MAAAVDLGNLFLALPPMPLKSIEHYDCLAGESSADRQTSAEADCKRLHVVDIRLRLNCHARMSFGPVINLLREQAILDIVQELEYLGGPR